MTNTVSHTTPSRPVPFTGTGRTLSPSFIANEIGLRAADRIDELALIGYPALDPGTRAVYETAIRLAAERVLGR